MATGSLRKEHPKSAERGSKILTLRKLTASHRAESSTRWEDTTKNARCVRGQNSQEGFSLDRQFHMGESRSWDTLALCYVGLERLNQLNTPWISMGNILVTSTAVSAVVLYDHADGHPTSLEQLHFVPVSGGLSWTVSFPLYFRNPDARSLVCGLWWSGLTESRSTQTVHLILQRGWHPVTFHCQKRISLYEENLCLV